MTDLAEFVASLPKAELHLHIEASFLDAPARAALLAELDAAAAA